MNRIQQLFARKSSGILSIFCTAGYPEVDDTVPIIQELAGAGVDLVEIGIPFSDPIADGPTIQAANQQALANEISLDRIFAQLDAIRSTVDIPLIMMGYLNPVLQYGMERFCQDANRVGVDGLILPDLPMFEYQAEYQALFKRHGLSHIFLISPQTSEARIREIDALSDAFIYVVSSDSTTGKSEGFGPEQVGYFQRIKHMQLSNPTLLGFGISDHQSFKTATRYLNGAIIGSAFIKALGMREELVPSIHTFVKNIRGNQINS